MFGFNGKENDNEVKCSGNSLDFGARIYDPRLGKFFSRDAMSKKYSNLSSYIFCEDNPVYFKDHTGNDAEVSISGNIITFTTKIYIYGDAATSMKAIEMQRTIIDTWRSNYRIKDGDKNYNIKFNVIVIASDPINSIIRSTPYSNAIELTDKKVRANVRFGKFGTWSAITEDLEWAHEMGHLMGLDDLYWDYYALISLAPPNDCSSYNLIPKNYDGVQDNDLMGKAASSLEGRVLQSHIDALFKYAKEQTKGTFNGYIKGGAMTGVVSDENYKNSFVEPPPLSCDDENTQHQPEESCDQDSASCEF